MTYRDELEQAHKRIELLEEELLEERAKHAPAAEPVVSVAPPATEPKAGPVRYLEWYAWWPIPLAVAAAIASALPFRDEALRWVIRSALAGATVMTLEAILRWRN